MAALHRLYAGLAFLAVAILPACGSGLCIEPARCSAQGTAAVSLFQQDVDFGTRVFQTSPTLLFTLTNSGDWAAQGLSVTVDSPFGFEGGSFPGTNGTCQSVLAARSSCVLEFVFHVPSAPPAQVTSSGTLTYFDGANQVTAEFTLIGSSDNGTFSVRKGFDNEVEAITSDSSGWYIGGEFAGMGDHSAHGLIRLTKDGLPDTTFATGGRLRYDGYVGEVLGVMRDAAADKLYVAGNYLTYDGTTANHFMRLKRDGSRDTAFNTGSGFSASVNAIAQAADLSGDIYVGGSFTSFNGTANVGRIVRLNSDGTRDASFATGTGFNSTVNTIVPALDGSNDVYVGGGFTTFNGTPSINYLVRLNSDGSRDAGFNVGIGTNSSVSEIYAFPDGRVLVGGSFTSYSGTPGINRLVLLSSTGAVDGTFATGTGLNGSVVGLAVDASNRFYIGGSFTSYNGTSVNRVARLLSDGSLDTTFSVGAGPNGTVNALHLSESGDELLIGGNFRGFDTQSQIGQFVRLSLTGAVLWGSPFESAFYQRAQAIAPARDGSGDLYVGGSFTDYLGYPAGRLIRLNSDGSLDSSFSVGSGANNTVYVLVASSSNPDQIYVGGNFTNYQGSTTGYFLRVRSDGSADPSFSAGAGFNSPVTVCLEDDQGRVYVGGQFSSFDGTSRNNIARILPNGALDTSFVVGIGFNNTVSSLAFAEDGSGDIYVGGYFTQYNGAPGINRLVRLNSDGSRDTGFATGTGFNNGVWSLIAARDGSGDVYVGGNFLTYQGAPREYLIRIDSNGSMDTAFLPIVNNAIDSIYALADGTGDILVGGWFYQVNGTNVTHAVRFTPAGVLKPEFFKGSGFTGSIYDIAPSQDGTNTIFFAGDFFSYNGTYVDSVARLTETGDLD